MNEQNYSNYNKEELIELLINKNKIINRLKWGLMDIASGKHRGPTYVRIANSTLEYINAFQK